MGALIPARIASVPGLPAQLLNRGFQPLTDRPVDIGSAVPLPISTIRSGALQGYTVRYKHIALFAATHVSAIVGNFTGDNNLSEAPGRNSARYRVRFQKNGAGAGAAGWNDMTPPRVPAFFNNSEWGDVPPGGVLFTDPVAFEVAAGETFFVWVAVSAPGASMYLPGGLATMGGVGLSALGTCDNGDALASDDVIASGTVTTAAITAYTGAVAILGASPIAQRTVGICGDSICNGATDSGAMAGRGGYLERMMMGLTNNVNLSAAVELTRVPNFPFIKCSRAGSTLANFVSRANNSQQLRLLSMCTTVICEYGLNDLSIANIATMKANYLSLAKYFTDRGVKFIQCTLTPRTTSTDNWLTAANQAIISGVETLRVGVNDWLRDASASGFVAQANASGLVDFLDVAAIFEVNAANILTLNGGRWPSAWSTNDATGALTAVSGGTYTDSALVTTQEQWRGYHLRMTSGAASGNVKEINSTWTGGRIVLPAPIAGSPQVGDAYMICQQSTLDGSHLGSETNRRVAAGLIAAGAFSKII